jgi:hypothetical protein
MERAGEAMERASAQAADRHKCPARAALKRRISFTQAF